MLEETDMRPQSMRALSLQIEGLEDPTNGTEHIAVSLWPDFSFGECPNGMTVEHPTRLLLIPAAPSQLPAVLLNDD